MNRVDLNRLCCQYTVELPVTFNDHGLMSARPVRMQIRPAPPEHGIVFRRTDLPDGDQRFPADWSGVFTAQGGVMLHNASRHTVGPVEHVLSALAGIGVDNAEVVLDGPELPVLDGSALPIVAQLIRHGIRFLPRPRDLLVVRRPVQVRLDGCCAALHPDHGPRLSLTDGRSPVSRGAGAVSLELSAANYVREIAPARAFGLGESEWRRQRMQDAADEGAPCTAIDTEGARFADEFIRHKALDAVGILALLGAPVIGHLHVSRPNHRVIVELIRTLMSDRTAWERVTAMSYFDEYGPLAAAKRPAGVDAGNGKTFDDVFGSGYDGRGWFNAMSRVLSRAWR